MPPYLSSLKLPDTWSDADGNGKFDPLYLAGFHQNHPAQGVHDDMEIRRAARAADLGFDHIIITSTHNHEAPDLMGLWGGRRHLPYGL